MQWQSPEVKSIQINEFLPSGCTQGTTTQAKK